MKIIKRKEFMKMPAGTVFSYYEPCVFHDLNIKTSKPEPDYPDFTVSYLIGAIKNDSSDEFLTNCDRMELGESISMDYEMSGREGLFEDEQLFAIYEKKDVEELIKTLQDTLSPHTLTSN